MARVRKIRAEPVNGNPVQAVINRPAAVSGLPRRPWMHSMAGSFANPIKPPMETILIILPPLPCFSIWTIACWSAFHTPLDIDIHS